MFLLDEVLAYNPDFEKELQEKPHIATVIRGFDGEVTIDNKKIFCKYGGDVRVTGKGKKGTPSFFTAQTAP